MIDRQPEKWKVLARRQLLDGRPWLTVWSEDLALPDGRVIEGFYKLDMPDYVVVVPVTEAGLVVAERQYKHGAGRESTQLPAGYVDRNESSLEAAKRELREETGYEASDWIPLGSFTVDANRGSGTAHFFLATGAHKVVAAAPDELGEISVELLPFDELVEALWRGDVALVSMAAALGLAAMSRRIKSPG